MKYNPLISVDPKFLQLLIGAALYSPFYCSQRRHLQLVVTERWIPFYPIPFEVSQVEPKRDQIFSKSLRERIIMSILLGN